jgi:hypothetical protein
MGNLAATSLANHCASTKATNQLNTDRTSYTKPRHAPNAMENTSTPRKIQSKVGMGSMLA